MEGWWWHLITQKKGLFGTVPGITRNLFYSCLTTKDEQTGLDKKNQPDSSLKVEKIKCEHFIRGLTKPLALLLFITAWLYTALCRLVRDRNTVSQIWDLPKAENTSNNNTLSSKSPVKIKEWIFKTPWHEELLQTPIENGQQGHLSSIFSVPLWNNSQPSHLSHKLETVCNSTASPNAEGLSFFFFLVMKHNCYCFKLRHRSESLVQDLDEYPCVWFVRQHTERTAIVVHLHAWCKTQSSYQTNYT